jgi:apolipoprotein N-acyltransferase
MLGLPVRPFRESLENLVEIVPAAVLSCHSDLCTHEQTDIQFSPTKSNIRDAKKALHTRLVEHAHMIDARRQQRFKAATQAALFIFASVVLLTFAAAPFGQWYLAWFALAPWLVAVGRASTIRVAMLRGWLTGVLYFAANLWWLWTASIPGTIVLVLYFALFWSIAAGLIRGLRLLPTNGSDRKRAVTVYRVFAIALVWVAAEWLRCYVASGFPWLPLGSTQSPILLMCQVADIGGPWIVSFWVMLTNALFATIWLGRNSPANWRASAVSVAIALVAVATYGGWRLQSTKLSPGPRVMVIQSNFRHLPGGAPTIDREHSVDFFIAELKKDLAEQPVDMVVLPEAAFPPLNDEARRELVRSPVGPFLESTFQRLVQVAKDYHSTLLLGGSAVTGWSTRGSEHIGSEIRNSAYFVDPQAAESVKRYDKVNLARFSERAPLTIGPNWLRQIATIISAPCAVQPMFAGELRDLRPFRLQAAASGDGTPFITPICLENIDPAVIAQMIRGSTPTGKQAVFVANISNDGWFSTQEKYQHLQTTVFRCIENRVPMVRCSNTGISAFIDSNGCVQESVAPGVAGFAVRSIQLDGRHTFYTRYGDVFPVGCVMFVAGAILLRFGCRLHAQNHAIIAKKRESSTV